MGAYSRNLKKRGLRWYYQGMYLGIRYNSKCIYKTRREALQAEREKLSDIDTWTCNPNNDMLLSDLVTFRYEDLRERKSEKYAERNNGYFKFLTEQLGSIKISEITKAMMMEVLKRLAKKKKGKPITPLIMP